MTEDILQYSQHVRFLSAGQYPASGGRYSTLEVEAGALGTVIDANTRRGRYIYFIDLGREDGKTAIIYRDQVEKLIRCRTCGGNGEHVMRRADGSYAAHDCDVCGGTGKEVIA